MACGTPVVATTNPGSIEILASGTYGRLVSDEQFADSLLDLLQSHGARETLRDAGRTRAAQFDLRRTIDEYERLVFSLANGHG